MANTKTTTRKAPAAKAAKAAPAKAATATPVAPNQAAYGLRTAPTAQGKRRTMLPENAQVTMVTLANPKQAGSGAHVRYQQYLALHKAGKFTVAHVLNAGVQPSDLIYNLKNGHIQVAGCKVVAGKVVVAS